MKMNRVEEGAPEEVLVPVADKKDPIVSEGEHRGYLSYLHVSGRRTIVLEKSTATFRSPTVRESLDSIRNGKGKAGQSDRLLAISACCKWDDSPRANLSDLLELRLKESRAITELLGEFFKPENTSAQIKEQEDYSVVVDFSGFKVVLRDPKATDIDFIQQSFKDGEGPSSIEAVLKVATRICIGWGDSSSASESDIESRPVGELITLGEVMQEHFL